MWIINWIDAFGCWLTGGTVWLAQFGVCLL